MPPKRKAGPPGKRRHTEASSTHPNPDTDPDVIADTPASTAKKRHMQVTGAHSAHIIPDMDPEVIAMATVDPDHRTMSRCLWEILDKIGLSPDVRETVVNTAITKEILLTLTYHPTDRNIAIYIFGSRCEGTTTTGLRSDMDSLCSDDNIPVVDNLEDAARYGTCLLLVRDSDTRPGYVKMQLVVGGVAQTGDMDDNGQLPDQYSVDGEGSVVMNHQITTSRLFHERNGPAQTRTDSTGNTNADVVAAFRCRKWPHCAREYLSRARPHNWPSHDQLQKLGTMGCFLVGIGHPGSPVQELEWRISFSLQERELMLGYNQVQYKCYVLLKVVKKEFITEQLGDSISSYHCKTCLFYAIETTPTEFWVPDNLVECLLHCLNIMSTWVTGGTCPNYFIPDENMFDRRVHGQLRAQVSIVLQHLLTENGRFLFRIGCDDVGSQLGTEVCRISFQEYTGRGNRIKLCHLYWHTLNIIRTAHHVLEYATNSNSIISCIQAHEEILARLDRTTTVTEHTESQTREAVQYLSPFIHTSMASHLAARLIQLANGNACTDELANIRLAMDGHIRNGLRSGIASCRLKVAAIHYMLGEYDTSVHLLSDVTSALLSCPTVNMCGCEEHHPLHLELMLDTLLRETKSPWSLAYALQTASISCVQFLSTEGDVTPPAMQYERFKSVGTPPASGDKLADRIVVDGSFFILYMLYLLCDKTGDVQQRRLAVEYLETLISTDDTLGHKETAYNLLGWIYKREGDANRAAMCFVESLRIEPIHNAAKWHIGDLYLRQANTASRCTTLAVIYSR